MPPGSPIAADRWVAMRTSCAVHVYPVRDLREHDTDGNTCWCEPRRERIVLDDDSLGGWLVTHHAADGRDLVEQHGVN